VDSFGIWGICTVAVFFLSLIIGSFLLALIWLAISAEVAAVLWTPLRGWLGIPEPRSREARQRRAELVDQDLELVDQGLEP
jgi:membrane protein implicated in regulation of membrane protease activity